MKNIILAWNIFCRFENVLFLKVFKIVIFFSIFPKEIVQTEFSLFYLVILSQNRRYYIKKFGYKSDTIFHKIEKKNWSILWLTKILDFNKICFILTKHFCFKNNLNFNKFFEKIFFEIFLWEFSKSLLYVNFSCYNISNVHKYSQNQ